MDFKEWRSEYGAFMNDEDLPWACKEFARTLSRTISVFYHKHNERACRFEVHALKGSAGALRQREAISLCDDIRAGILESKVLGNTFDYNNATIKLLELLFKFEKACKAEGFKININGIIADEFPEDKKK